MIDQNLERTNAALSELTQSVDTLKVVLKKRKAALLQQKEAYQNNMAQKNAQINRLKSALETAVDKIGRAAQKIDEVLEENGTSHNSN